MTNPELRARWSVDVKTMTERIITMRTQLKKGLIAQGNKDGFSGDKVSCFHFLGSAQNWQHITDQIGMWHLPPSTTINLNMLQSAILFMSYFYSFLDL